MCKERKIPEILICAPCDAVTEEDAENMNSASTTKECSEEESLSAALLTT